MEKSNKKKIEIMIFNAFGNYKPCNSRERNRIRMTESWCKDNNIQASNFSCSNVNPHVNATVSLETLKRIEKNRITGWYDRDGCEASIRVVNLPNGVQIQYYSKDVPVEPEEWEKEAVKYLDSVKICEWKCEDE